MFLRGFSASPTVTPINSVPLRKIVDKSVIVIMCEESQDLHVSKESVDHDSPEAQKYAQRALCFICSHGRVGGLLPITEANPIVFWISSQVNDNACFHEHLVRHM